MRSVFDRMIMGRKYVNFSTLRSVGYDAKARVLEVEFSGG